VENRFTSALHAKLDIFSTITLKRKRKKLVSLAQKIVITVKIAFFAQLANLDSLLQQMDPVSNALLTVVYATL
jgi:hypothetical protein